ncbi:MAG: HipA-like protein, partial [Gemmataceae bacterium]
MGKDYGTQDVSDWQIDSDECMGSKRKFWLMNEEERWLFKVRHRSHTGDDWAEKIAAELAELLRLP